MKEMLKNIYNSWNEADIVITFPKNDYTDAQKAMLKRAADTCPVGKSLHPDVKVNLTMNF